MFVWLRRMPRGRLPSLTVVLSWTSRGTLCTHNSFPSQSRHPVGSLAELAETRKAVSVWMDIYFHFSAGLPIHLGTFPRCCLQRTHASSWNTSSKTSFHLKIRRSTTIFWRPIILIKVSYMCVNTSTNCTDTSGPGCALIVFLYSFSSCEKWMKAISKWHLKLLYCLAAHLNTVNGHSLYIQPHHIYHVQPDTSFRRQAICFSILNLKLLLHIWYLMYSYTEHNFGPMIF